MLFQLLTPSLAEPSLSRSVTAWWLLYCTHAVVWALGAALLGRSVSLRPAVEHALWRLAWVGPLVATIAAAAWPAISACAAQAWLLRTRDDQSALARGLTVLASGRSRGSLSDVDALLSWTVPGDATCHLVVFTLLGLSAVGLLRFAIATARFRRALRGRTRVVDRALSERFARLGAQLGLHGALLSESVHVAGPLVVGRREVCIPRGLLSGYSEAEIEAVLAHELAHVERADGVWFLLVSLLQSVLWMQPVAHWVSARFRRSAELAADERAVAITGAPMALARALTQMAETALRGRRQPAVPAMTGQASLPVERVRRLVRAADPRSARQGSLASARRWPALCLSALGLFAALTLRTEKAPQDGGDSRVRPSSALSTTRHHEEMDQLAQQAWELAQLLEAAHAGSASERAVLEQSLRHVRAMAAWKERSFNAASLASKPPPQALPTPGARP
jgi:Zn-dependent protease with chaperone function